jgi:glutamyl-tRNA synthetase
LAYIAQADFRAFCQSLAAATDKKGKALFMPLRVALTSETHGPEMDKIWRLLGEERIRERFLAAAALCKE